MTEGDTTTQRSKMPRRWEENLERKVWRPREVIFLKNGVINLRLSLRGQGWKAPAGFCQRRLLAFVRVVLVRRVGGNQAAVVEGLWEARSGERA